MNEHALYHSLFMVSCTDVNNVIVKQEKYVNNIKIHILDINIEK